MTKDSRQDASELLHKAIEFAALSHRSQIRKGTDIPYIVHPFEVALLLTAEGCGANTIAAGLLHDTIEDTGVGVQDIEEAFGGEVSRLVSRCSENKADSWEERKKHTIEELKSEGDRDVLMVTCADKLSNLRSIKADYQALGDALWERFNRGKEKQQWYYHGLVEALEPLQGTSMYQELKEIYRSIFDIDEDVRNYENENVCCQLKIAQMPKGVVVKTYIESDHLDRMLFRCERCGCLFLYEFYEIINWNGGEDSLYSTFVHVKDEKDAEKLASLDPLAFMMESKQRPHYMY